MVPFERATVVSYRLSMVTIELVEPPPWTTLEDFCPNSPDSL